MTAPSCESLVAFERTVADLLRAGRERTLAVLGYGEVTTVLALDERWAVKRLPGFSSEQAAHACADVIRRYVTELGVRGIDVVETQVDVVPAGERSWSVYCVQPRLAADALGPAHVRALDVAGALGELERILDAVAGAVTATVAPDGQLSNWAFVGDRMLYLDVSSPFLRDARGHDLLDWSQYLRSLPLPLRPLTRRWILPRLLNKYFTLRGQVVDLLGNLIKERLGHLIEPVRRSANARLALEPAVRAEEVYAYYRSDARTYAFLQAVRKADRWVQRRVLGRPYPYILPPSIDRNL